MCKAFSAIVTKSKKVYWQVGLDSHDKLVEKFKKDKELKDDKLPPENTFARIEITPPDGNYFNFKQKWQYQIDEKVKPSWLDISYEKLCIDALKLWQKEICKKVDYKALAKPIYPFKIIPPKKITTRHLKLLVKWVSVRDSVWASVWASVRASVKASVGASIRASVRDSVWDSVGASVWASVGASVKDSVGDSVWASVWDSVGAYSGTFFPKIKKWEYCSKVKEKGYPFKSAVKLWKMGLVPSYSSLDNKWRLHGGTKAEVLYEGTIKEIKKAIKETK